MIGYHICIAPINKLCAHAILHLKTLHAYKLLIRLLSQPGRTAVLRRKIIPPLPNTRCFRITTSYKYIKIHNNAVEIVFEITAQSGIISLFFLNIIKFPFESNLA